MNENDVLQRLACQQLVDRFFTGVLALDMVRAFGDFSDPSDDAPDKGSASLSLPAAFLRFPPLAAAFRSAAGRWCCWDASWEMNMVLCALQKGRRDKNAKTSGRTGRGAEQR